MDQLLKEYNKKKALRDKYLDMLDDGKESIAEVSNRTGRSIAHIQYSNTQFMRKAMDRQKDMDKIAEKMEEINK